jgi:hypothetical protein
MSPLVTKDSVITLDYVSSTLLALVDGEKGKCFLSQGTYTIPSSSHGEISSGGASSDPLGKRPLSVGFPGGGGSSGSGVVAGSDDVHSPPGPEDDEDSMDWWTKYFASVDAMIEVILGFYGSQCPHLTY